MHKFILYLIVSTLLTLQLQLYAAEEAQDEVTDETGTEEVVVEERGVKRPHHEKMKNSELTLDNKFSSFRNGPMFSPELMFLAFLFGYLSKTDLFADFFSSLSANYSFDEENNVEVVEDEVCVGEGGNESEGVVKLTFDCSGDGLIYSCYADLIDGEYSISIPKEVEGLACQISVEAGKMNSNESDVEVNGVTTTEEVDLSDGDSVVIDVSSDDNQDDQGEDE